jgi:tRNA (guanine-N7-)-methyltransferase
LNTPEPLPRRSIRSFVLRQGRVSAAQQRAHDTLLPRFGIPFAPGPLSLETVFGRKAPKILEIGFGMGETTACIAAANPHKDYLGIEVHTPGVGSLLKEIGEKGLTNIRIIQHDAVDVLQAMIEADSLDGVHIFFPDPWPKKRHHKRRLLQPPLIALLASRMKPGAYLHTATDWEEYAAQMLQVLSAEPSLVNTAVNTSDDPSGYVPRPDYRPQTKFETRGLKLGHRVWDLVFRKRPDYRQFLNP